jgi:hypothetical protein
MAYEDDSTNPSDPNISSYSDEAPGETPDGSWWE